MTPEIAKAVIDALFEELEKKFANKPVMLAIIHVLHVAADALLPLVLTKVEGVKK